MLNTHTHTHTHSATQRGPETQTPTEKGLLTPSPFSICRSLEGTGQSPDPGVTPFRGPLVPQEEREQLHFIS